MLTYNELARWATVWRRAVVRSAPRATADAVATIGTRTTDGMQNIVLVLRAVDVSPSETWLRVRLPIFAEQLDGVGSRRHLVAFTRGTPTCRGWRG